jgi:hypothetical protein
LKTRRRSRDTADGQALVEFALAITVFIMLLMGVVDLGRGIYMYNGASQAAREVARATSVHPGSPLGSSVQTVAVITTPQSLIPGLQAPTFACVDITGAAVSATCTSGDFVRVTITAPFSPITPLLGLTGTWNLQSTSIVELQ